MVMVRCIERISIPYIMTKQKHLGLRKIQTTLAIFGVFPAHHIQGIVEDIE